MVNAEKWGVKIKCGGDANLLLPNFGVLPALSSNLSVFSKLCIMNTPLHLRLLLCQSRRSLRNVSFGGHILGLIKSAYHGWLNMMTSSEGPFLVLPRAPPILNPPLVPTAKKGVGTPFPCVPTLLHPWLFLKFDLADCKDILRDRNCFI